MSEVLNKLQIFQKLKNNKTIKIKLFNIFKDNSIDIKAENENKTNTIIVTEDDNVYACGYNNSGVLGFGHENIVNDLTIVTDICNKGIIDIKNSIYHTIARTSDGKLYCWGRNCFGVLGNGINDSKLYKPILIEYLINKQTIQMSCGSHHTLVLTNDGEMYGWGYNKYGQIGNRKSGHLECQILPYFIDEFNGEKVKSISCGYWHSLALTECGQVFSWGSNNWGELGRNICKYFNSNRPIPIELCKEIIINKISCGSHHSLLLSIDGEIYVFGNNSNKELGIKTESGKQLLPIKSNNLQKFSDIASLCNKHFSSALSFNGLYYIWGNCDNEGIIKNAKATQFKSFNEIFCHYFGITYNTMYF